MIKSGYMHANSKVVINDDYFGSVRIGTGNSDTLKDRASDCVDALFKSRPALLKRLKEKNPAKSDAGKRRKRG